MVAWWEFEADQLSRLAAQQAQQAQQGEQQEAGAPEGGSAAVAAAAPGPMQLPPWRRAPGTAGACRWQFGL